MSERIVPDDAKILCQAQNVIQDKENWCHGRMVRKNGENYQYCAVGSVAKAMGVPVIENHGSPEFSFKREEQNKFDSLCSTLNKTAAKMFPGEGSVVAVNDNTIHGHGDVMKVFYHTIDELIKEANPK